MAITAAVLLGILIGWTLEWALDLLYWRPRVRALEAENARLRAQAGQTPVRLESQGSALNVVEQDEAA